MVSIIIRAPSEGSVTMPGFAKDEIPLGEYLFLRICQANPKLRSVFGIPGDFNLTLLEHLYSETVAAKVEFVGFCNELNAAYASDGYAKAIGGLSVLITTFGVGELSALNGIAGAYTEYAPVLHIVGTTSTEQTEEARNTLSPLQIKNIHHLVQNRNALAAPNHNVYKSIAKKVSVIQKSLDTDAMTNLDRIDQVLATVIHERRPGYLFMPVDVPDIMVPSYRLTQPLVLNEIRNEAFLAEMSLRILGKLYASHRPSVLGDALADRFGAQDALNTLIGSLPAEFVKLFTTIFARNIDESLPNYVGVYTGRATSDCDIIKALEDETDFLLVLGYLNNEINSGAYSTNYSKINEVVEVHPDYILIDGEYVHTKNAESGERHFSIADLIQRLASDFKVTRLVHNNGQVNNIKAKKKPKIFSLHDTVPKEVITQNKLLDFFNLYLRPNDIFVCETCSFLFGSYELSFPRGVTFYAQNLYESIGYALPATFGIARAQKDLGTHRRIVLVQGDGSAQMTIQELSTYLRYDIQAPEIFLLNNEGYTVERIIKGPTRPYNDIQSTWKWTEIFRIFGDAKCEKHEAEKADTMSELLRFMGRKNSSKIRLCELKLAKMDISRKFKVLRGDFE